MGWIVMTSVVLLGNCETQGQVVNRVSAPGKFFVDDKSSLGLLYNYAAYMISNNTAATIPSVYVSITNIAGTNLIQLASTDTGVRALGALSPGQAKMAAFYLKGPSLTANAQSLLNLTNENHTIFVLNGPPGVGSVLASANFGFTNIIYAIEALANKITLITNLNAAALLGSTVTMLIGGDTGTIGGQNSVSFSPAVLGGWRPDAYELVGSRVVFTQNPAFTNQIYLDPTIPGFTNFSGQSYTNTFTFRAVKPTGTNIQISPFDYVDSGSGTKHTAFSSLSSSGGSNVIYSATNVVNIINQTVTPNSLFAPGGIVTYTITFTNFAVNSGNITLDEIVDLLPGTPANATFVPGSATFNAAPLADPIIVGQALHWATPFVIPATNISVLTFQAVAPLPAGAYTNSVTALIGSTQIDSTSDTTDNSPSRSVFTIIPVSDVAVVKTGPGSVVAAANFNYTVTVTNLGPSPVIGLSVTDSLPASVTFVSASGGGFLSGGQVIWTNLAVLANAASNLIITVTSPSESTTLTNRASGASPFLDPNLTNNTAPPVITAVIASADLRVGKSGPALVNPGATFNYTITVTNAGPSKATSLSVTDNLPAGVTFVSASAGGVLNGGQVLWANIGDLAAGLTTNLILTVTAPNEGASLSNIATVTSPVGDPQLTNNTSPPVLTTVTPLADVAVTKTAPFNVNLGAGFAYSISITNQGPSTSTGISVTDSLPASVTFVSASAGGVLNGNAVVWTNFSLAAGSVTNFTLNVLAPNTISVLTNIASGIGNITDPNLTNNTTPPVITLVGASADLAVRKSAPASINASANFNYTINVTNLGPTGASSVSVTDNLPASVTFVSASAGGMLIGGQVIWADLGILGAGASTNLMLTVTAPANGMSLTNTASVGSPAPDPVSTNNLTPPVITTVSPVADLAIGKAGPASIFAGTNFDYIVAVTNLGPSSSGNISVTDNLPAGVSFISAAPTASTNGSQVVWSLGSLAAGATTNLTLTVKATLRSALTNFASVVGPALDPNLTNNLTPPVVTLVTNRPPVATDDSYGLNKNSLLSLSAPGVLSNDTDLDGDSLTAVLVTTTAHGSLTLNANGSFTYTPFSNYFGADSFTYRAGDGFTNSTIATVSLTITNINRAPLAVDDAATTAEDTSVSIPVLVNDTDLDGDALTITSATATNGTVSIVGTNLLFTPSANFNGIAFLNYAISDGLGGTASANVSVTVTPVNDPPVAVNDTATTPEDTAITIPVLANDSDVDGDALTITVATATNGTVSIVGTNLVFTPATNFNGLAMISYTISDGHGGTASASVSVTVTPVNDPPVARNDSATTPEETGVSIPVLVNDSDVDGDVLTITGVTATNGTVSIIGTNLLFTPAVNFNGQALINYTINDGHGGSASATVTVTVTPVNDPPVAVNDLASTPEDTAISIPVLINDTDADGDTLTITSATTTNGTVSIVGTNLLFTPTANFHGATVIVYSIADGNGGTASAVVNVTVTAVNDPPIALNDTATTPEDTGVTVPVLVNDSDADGDVLTITSATTTNGTVSIVGTNLLFTPALNFNGLARINYSISDGNGGTASATVTVTVTPVNDPPVAVNDTATTSENTAVSVPVLVNDSDVDGDALTITGATATNGTVSVVGTNVLFTPTASFNGNAFVNYTISDGHGGTASAIVTITVTPVNDPPVAVNDTATTPEDNAVSIPVLVNDSDIDGDALTITSATATNGTVSIVGTNLLFTPSANFHGVATVNYTISDGHGGTASAIVTITVTPVNDPPVAVNDIATTPEDTAISIAVLVNDSDLDGDALTITGATGTNGTVSIVGTNMLFTPALNFNGIATLNYTISDGHGGTASATVAVTVTPVNDPPVAINDSATTPEDTSVSIPVLVNDSDVDGDVLTITSATATNGAVSIVGTNLLFTPSANFNGIATVNYTISDGHGGSASAIVTITVTAVNDPPVAVNDTATTPEDTAVSIAVLANDSDVDGDILTIISATGTNGTVSIVGTNLLFTPAANFNGTVVVNYTISDGHSGTASASVTITVTPVNDPPVAVNDTATTPEDTSVSISVLINDTDADGDALAITSATTTNGTVSVVGTNLVFTPATNFNGTALLTYSISDGHGGTASANVTVSVTPVNDPPVAVNDLATTPEDTAVSIAVLANDSDADGDALTIISATGTNGTVSILGTNLLFTPAVNFNGIATLNYSIGDGHGGTASATVAVTVTPVNDPPVAANDTATTPEDTSVSIPVLVNDTDADGDALTITSATATNGTVSIVGTNLLFTPAANFSGTASLGYTISDGHGGTASANVTVTVTPVNDPPVAVNDAATTPEDTAVSIPVLVNDSDIDGDALTITAATATNGTVSIVGTNLFFTPATNFNGAATISYTISDGHGGTASATVNVSVTPANDPPVALNDSATTPEDTTVSIPVLMNDSDVDGDVLAITSATAAGGSVSIVGTNLVFTPVTNFNGTVNLSYTISDGHGGSASASVTVLVTPVNDPPSALNDIATTAEDTSVTIPVLANDFDVDGDTLTIMSATTTNGTLNISGTNLVFLPGANFNGTATLFYSISDGHGGTASASVTVIVTPDLTPLFSIHAGSNVFNPQNGLFEQHVAVTNTGSSTVPAVQLLVGGLRTNIALYNAMGTNGARPYVQYNAPLNPGQGLVFLLEFYVPDRRPFTNTLEAQAVLPATIGTNSASGVPVTRSFVDSRIPGEPRFVIEFDSIPGRTYTIIYSDDMVTWRAATPSLAANATRTQWYDDGPPKTPSKPLSNTSRFYRVIVAPAIP